MKQASTRVLRRPRRAWLPDVLIAAAILALILLAVVACSSGSGPSSASSGGSPDAGGSAGSPSLVGYSHCMRSNGVPNYPDPNSNGTPPKTSAQELGISGSQLQAAQRACQHLLPNTSGSFITSFEQCVATSDCPQALVRQAMTKMLTFARCMRSHGVPNWPDPTIGRGGAPFFDVTSHGLTHAQTHSSQMESKFRECQRVAGGAPILMG